MTVGGEDPEGGGDVVEESAGGNGHTVQDGGFNWSLGYEQIYEEIQNQDLGAEGNQGGGVVMKGLPPVGRPVVEGPEGIEEVIGATANDPGEGGGSGYNGVIGRMPAEVIIADRKKEPDKEGIEQGSQGPHRPESGDPENFGAVQAGRLVPLGGRGEGGIHEDSMMAGMDFRGNWLERGIRNPVQDKMAGITCHGLGESELEVAVRDLIRQETLIIRGELTEPPSWFPSFRELTMRLKGSVVSVILIESDRKMRDLYWRWTGRNGGRDFVNDLIFSDEYVPGIKLDSSHDRLHPTVTTEKIVPENLDDLAGRVAALAALAH